MDYGAGSKGFHGALLRGGNTGAVSPPPVSVISIGVTIVTEVNIATYDARPQPTRDHVATRTETSMNPGLNGRDLCDAFATVVLDFANTAEDIIEAFEPYYCGLTADGRTKNAL